MKLIIGLGNPGKDYEKTKHNIGFLFLDNFADKNKFSDFKYESKFKGDIATGFLNGEKTILLKPQTYMNLSGESIIALTNFYKIEKDDWLVIYDDMSMDFGKLRFRNKGSAGGHNGVKSIISYFKEDFNRIKVGIGFNPNFEVSDWVLSKFNEEELIEIDSNIYKNIVNLIEEKF